MNIQLKRFGRAVTGFNPSIPNNDFIDIGNLFTAPLQMNEQAKGEPLIVCLYFDKGDDLQTSYIKSEQDLSEWVIEYQGQRYQCQKSHKANSDLFKTIIVPLNERDLNIDTSSVTL